MTPWWAWTLMGVYIRRDELHDLVSSILEITK